MPLSELYRLSKRRVESNQDFEPGKEVYELVWENGQITTQGQSSRVRKDPTCNTLPSHCLPSYNPKSRDKDLVGNGTTNTTTRAGKFGTAMDSVTSEIPMSVPSDEVGLGHEDDMIQWLNYPIDASLQSDYCPEFLPELSGVTVHENSKSNIFAPNEKIACNQLFRDSSTVSTNYFAALDQRNNASKTVASSAVGGDAVRPRTGITSQLCPITSSQLCQASFSSIRSRVLETNGDNGGGVAHNAACSNSVRVGSTSFPRSKMQKPDLLPPSTSANLINFSHFSRPAVLAKANSIEMMSIKDKACAASGASPLKTGLVDLSGKFRREIVDLKATRAERSTGAKHSEAVPREEASKNDANSNQIACESTTRGLQDGKKNTEPVVASSSVCSGNSVERASDELPTHVLKRKFRDAEDSECHSEDVEEESVGGVKKTVLLRGSSSKRGRAAEVHNLSERRRRDRINEKMRALQELIPNCNKVDKASMLDEAIEYLKTLQLQVQIMSFGAGLCMPPMMLPPGMQHMLPHQMAHFSPMGMGLGMGMGMGFGMGMPDMNGTTSGYPMLQVPPLQGAHFPGPQMAGHNAALHGMGGPNMQVFGIPSQGMTMTMQRPPLVPVMGGPFMKPSMALNASAAGGSLENVEPAAQPYTASDTAVQTTGANRSMTQASTQCQATTEVFEQPALVQSNAHVSDANTSKVSASDNVNDTGPASYE